MTEEAVDDFEPWGDPNIRPEYEAALGPCLVAFNEVEDRMRVLMTLALGRRGQLHLSKRVVWDSQFGQKVTFLELLSSRGDEHSLRPTIFQELRQLANDRNVVAHGHFDQNPFDGSFKLRGKGDSVDFDTDKLLSLTRRSEALAKEIGEATLPYWFEEIRNLDDEKGIK